jgi:hypothetical protein
VDVFTIGTATIFPLHNSWNRTQTLLFEFQLIEITEQTYLIGLTTTLDRMFSSATLSYALLISSNGGVFHQGKNTRDITKELRMSLIDISTALRDNQVNHGIVTTKDNGNGNNTNETNKAKEPIQFAMD